MAAVVVDGQGDVVSVTAETHPDLLWALRGGGGNFGVVTELTLQCVRISEMSVYQLAVAPGDAHEGLCAIRDFMKSASDEVTAVAFVRTLPPVPGLPPSLVGRSGLFCLLTHCGSRTAAEEELAPLLTHPAIAALHESRLSPLELRQRMETAFPFSRFGAHFRSGFTAELPDDVLGRLIETALALPTEHSALEFVPLGGAVEREDGSAPGRGAAYMCNAMGLWLDERDATRTRDWANTLDQTLDEIRISSAVVPGFMSRDEIDRAVVTYGADFARLAAVKRRHDPLNLFSTTLNIQPSQEE